MCIRDRNKDAGRDTDRTQKAFFVSAQEIRDSNYDLSLTRYKKRDYVVVKGDPSNEILNRMKSLNEEIGVDLAELEGLLG